jgi:hypothetical protein
MPALAMPAGYTNDGLPVGIELMGRRFDDAKLVGFAYAYEQAVHPRRQPYSTPPLVAGAAPRPIAFDITAATTNGAALANAHFTLDAPRSELRYDVRVSGSAERVFAIALQRGTAQQPGAIVYRLSGPGVGQVAGVVNLSATDRDELLGGKWSLVVYTAEQPAAASARAVIAIPH